MKQVKSSTPAAKLVNIPTSLMAIDLILLHIFQMSIYDQVYAPAKFQPHIRTGSYVCTALQSSNNWFVQQA